MENLAKIIAEIGVNHNGDLCLAKESVDAAREAGADCVKFQLFSSKKLAASNASMGEYQVRNTGKRGSQLQMLEELELSADDVAELKKYCSNGNIEFLLSAFDEDSLKVITDRYKMHSIKVPSGEITNIPMLIEIGNKFEEIYLSTGMSFLSDIELAIAALCYGKRSGGVVDFSSSLDAKNKLYEAYNDEKTRHALLQRLILLQCTSEYPAPAEDINLKSMIGMSKIFNCRVGFSDHTVGYHIPVAAVAMGASVVEKHFTLDKNLPGPDHLASSSPMEFRLMVDKIRDVELAMGSSLKTISKSETNTISIARKFVTAIDNIEVGDRFSLDNICVKRSRGTAAPIRIYDFIGNKSKKKFMIGDDVC